MGAAGIQRCCEFANVLNFLETSTGNQFALAMHLAMDRWPGPGEVPKW